MTRGLIRSTRRAQMILLFNQILFFLRLNCSAFLCVLGFHTSSHKRMSRAELSSIYMHRHWLTTKRARAWSLGARACLHPIQTPNWKLPKSDKQSCSILYFTKKRVRPAAFLTTESKQRVREHIRKPKWIQHKRRRSAKRNQNNKKKKWKKVFKLTNAEGKKYSVFSSFLLNDRLLKGFEPVKRARSHIL